MKLSRAMKRMFRAELLSREEKQHFREVVIPEQAEKVARDLSALVQEFAPSASVVWEPTDTEKRPA